VLQNSFEMKEIDINCDMGESYGRFQVGDDQALFPFISSCNIACGFHGGDGIAATASPYGVPVPQRAFGRAVEAFQAGRAPV